MAARLPRRLAWLAVGALALVMTLGNIVSSTGSGLGCPDWPLCHGRVIPPGGTEIWIEFRHRLAVPLFSVLLVATAFLTWRRATAPALRRLAVALVGLLIAQIVLGGVTVLLGLSPLVSTVHLLTALTVLAGLITICAVPLAGRGAAEGETSNSTVPRPPEPRLARLATAGLVVLIVQLALGGYVRHSGAGLACPDFPLCSGDVFPGHWLGWVHWLHRWLGVLLLGFFLHLAWASRRGALAGVGVVVAGAALAQVSLGILAVLLRLPTAVRASHAVVAYALWALLVWIAVRASGWGAAVGSITDPLGSTTDPLGSPSAAPRQATTSPRQATTSPRQATAARRHSTGRE
ncbi:MAG TPA: COX15/CtaA family protein [Candidatus Nitrosocosmicus sp.]|nr:COX15/CtaA family protein [Candidatus Nitrosocosmicus sp.]